MALQKSQKVSFGVYRLPRPKGEILRRHNIRKLIRFLPLVEMTSRLIPTFRSRSLCPVFKGAYLRIHQILKKYKKKLALMLNIILSLLQNKQKAQSVISTIGRNLIKSRKFKIPLCVRNDT